MMRRVQFALIAALVGAFVWFALPGFADSQARIVRLSYLEGEVQIDRHGGEGFEKAILNMPITQGTVLRTGNNGRAEVEFENGSTVRLVPDSEAVFQQLSLRSSGAKVTDVAVNRGSAYFNVRHKDDEFRVAFANRNVVVNRDADFRVNVGRSEVKLAVFKGEVDLEGEGREVAVKKNETLTLDLDDGSRYLLAKGVEPSPYDEWSKNRDQYQREYASSSYASAYPYYGREDLSYYGSYWYMPGYGNLWQPYNTGLGWDPFLNGAWSWYPGFGYTWVSTYPWGWLPYRYGSWVFIPGWGWGWMPANSWRNWAAVPRIVNPPSSFLMPRPPATPTHSTVVVSNPTPRLPVSSTGIANTGSGTSSVQPTPLPAKPHRAITPGPTGTSTKSGVVTVPAPTSSKQAPAAAAPASSSRSPSTSTPHSAAPDHGTPHTAPPHSTPPERATPHTAPPQAQPQSWSRPSSGGAVRSYGAAPAHSYSGHETHGSSERPPR